ncbi:MAG: porin family protein [Paramuribaculum sp.]|nr:porin family protein [Paramuribaculum sp.]
MITSPLRMAMPALACLMTLPSQARDDSEAYRFDIGGGIGMSGYLGEANSSSLFSHPGFAGYLQSRYIFNERTALRAQLSLMTLSGNTADLDNALPGNVAYDFSATATSFDVRGEFNFLPYGIGETYRNLHTISPFIAGGCGLTVSASEGDTFAAFSVPLSAGVKYKPSLRLNLIAEFTMTKVFGDHLDGPLLADLNGIRTSFINNSDWHSTVTVGVTYEFGPRCVVCNRLD